MNAAEYIRSFHAALAIRRGGELVSREEYLDHLTFRANRRPLFTEIFGPLLGLKEEWAAQGASPGELDLSAFHFRDVQEYWLPVSTQWLGGPPEVIVKETATDLIYRDRMGRRMQMSKLAATLALPMSHPVATMDDWRRVRSHYTFDPARLAGDWQHPPEDVVVTLGIPGGFDEPRQLMGEAGLATACYDQPELLHEMLATFADTACRVLEAVTRVVRVDALSVHEDMAGRSGPLFGPRQVREFVAPYYRQVWALARDRGVRLFKQDSDGDMRPVMDAFLDAGVNVMYPCEPAANMDIVALRAKYGTRLALIGGIDKHVLRMTPEKIEAELEYKLPPLVRTGGCVLGLDHRIPNGTSLSNYRFYLAKMWEIMDREAVACRPT